MAIANPTGADAVHVTNCHWKFPIGQMRQRPQFETLVVVHDFKLRLASGLTGTVPLTHTQVTGDDTMLELGVKVLGNTASAILQMRGHLSRETVDRAIDLLNAADRIELYGTAAQFAHLTTHSRVGSG